MRHVAGRCYVYFFYHVSRANVTLSLLMTTCSTFLALGMMPLLIFVYVRRL